MDQEGSANNSCLPESSGGEVISQQINGVSSSSSLSPVKKQPQQHQKQQDRRSPSPDGDTLMTVPVPRATFSFQEGFRLAGRGGGGGRGMATTTMVDSPQHQQRNGSGGGRQYEDDDDDRPLYPSERRRRNSDMNNKTSQVLYDDDGFAIASAPRVASMQQPSIHDRQHTQSSKLTNPQQHDPQHPHRLTAADVAAELASGEIIYGLNNPIDSDDDDDDNNENNNNGQNNNNNNNNPPSSGGGGGGALATHDSFARRIPDLDKVVAPSGVDMCGCHIKTELFAAVCTCMIVFFGVAMEVYFGEEGQSIAELISSLLGWWYFLAWSVSFVPQIYINWRRKSVIGQSFEFQYLNLLGYFFLTVYDSSFYFSTEIQNEYQRRFGSKNEVELNDVGFAVFALTLTIWNCWQIAVYERGDQKTARWCKIAIAVAATFISVWAIAIFVFKVRGEYFFDPLDLLYGMGLCKALVTATKYIPQVRLNYKRKCTVGWNIWNVLLDWTGGFMSCVQEIMDAWINNAWEALAGNWVKLALGGFSFMYDTIFIIQHFCLYNENNRKLISLFEARRAALKEEEGEMDAGVVDADDVQEVPGNTVEMKAVAPQ